MSAGEFLLSIISLLASSLFVWFFTGRTEKREYTKEHYEKVLFPIMTRLEPILYKSHLTDSELEIVAQCKSLAEKESLLAGPTLIFDLSRDFSEYSDYRFYNFCIRFCNQYNKCCTALGLPRFSYSHRSFIIEKNNPKMARKLRIRTVIYTLLTILPFILVIVFHLVISILNFFY